MRKKLTDVLCVWETVLPWGRVYPVRADLTKAVLLEQEGGNGNSRQFWEWCEQQVKDYL